MKPPIAPVLLVFLFLGTPPTAVFSQKNDRAQDAAKIWQLVAAQLDQWDVETSRQHILLLVRGHCDGDLACQLEIYDELRGNMERQRFDLPAAIFLAEEMARVAEKAKKYNREGDAYRHLSRYHESLGNFSAFSQSLEKALACYERAGQAKSVRRCKIDLEDIRFRYEPFDTVYPAFRPLIEQAEQARDTLDLINIHLRLLQLCFELGQFQRCEHHLQIAEGLLARSPNIPEIKTIYSQTVIATHRAQLASQKNDFPEAKRFWLLAIELAQQRPDRWQEAYAAHALANLEWQTGQSASAKKHLEGAERVATAAKIDEHLANIFALKSAIAEAEGKPAAALEFKKKEIFHATEFKNRGAGFDFQAHFLKLEKERQRADLELRNLQLLGSVALLLLALALAVGLVLAYRNQKKSADKLAEQKAVIQKQAEELQSLDEAKSQFFANVSHELRTPLSLILGPIASLLKESQPPEKQKRLLKMASQSGEQLQQLVDEILDLTKLEAGKMTVHTQPTELVPFFRRHLAQFESLAASRRVHFSFEILAANDATAKIDQGKIRQIVSNLLANAFKFTAPGGFVRANLSLENGQLRIGIADSGAGIHPADLPHLFERYFQTKQTDRPAGGGTGIGLALCREYAELLGGKIWAESVLGEGSKFFVSLPILLESGVSGTEKTAQPQGMDFPIPEIMDALPPVSKTKTALKSVLKIEQPRLLVVEDNPELQDYLRLVLEEKYRVEVAENGQVALEKIAAGSGFQLILSDLMMPVMDGWQLAQKLKSDDATRHLPLVMLTARAGATDKLEALRLGVDDYLAKPFVEEELLARIENLLKNQRGRQQFFAQNKPETDAPVFSKEDQMWLANFEKYVAQHLANAALSVPQMAADFALSESSLLRQLKRLTGLSAVQYLQEARLSEARRLLEDRAFRNVDKVVAAVGYGDARNFSRSFKARFGRTPSEYLGA